MGEANVQSDVMRCNCVINSCAHQGGCGKGRAVVRVERGGQRAVRCDEILQRHPFVSAKGDVKRAEQWFEQIEEANVQSGVTSYSVAISACKKGVRRKTALELL